MPFPVISSLLPLELFLATPTELREDLDRADSSNPETWQLSNVFSREPDKLEERNMLLLLSVLEAYAAPAGVSKGI